MDRNLHLGFSGLVGSPFDIQFVEGHPSAVMGQWEPQPRQPKKTKAERRSQLALNAESCSAGGSAYPRPKTKPSTDSSGLDKPFKCEICLKSFKQITNLNAHSRIHTGERPYGCEKCGKSFTQVSNLNAHARTHTGDKPYKCPVCGKCFTQVSNLTAHSRTHTGLKPYRCEVCERCFAQSSNLGAHVRTHTGQRPYKCLTCGKSFAQVSNLNAHIRTHTGEKSGKRGRRPKPGTILPTRMDEHHQIRDGNVSTAV